MADSDEGTAENLKVILDAIGVPTDEQERMREEYVAFRMKRKKDRRDSEDFDFEAYCKRILKLSEEGKTDDRAEDGADEGSSCDKTPPKGWTPYVD